MRKFKFIKIGFLGISLWLMGFSSVMAFGNIDDALIEKPTTADKPRFADKTQQTDKSKKAVKPFIADKLKIIEKPAIEKRDYLKSGLFDLTIMGGPIATKEQCVSYLLRHNPMPLITTSPKTLVDYYYLEGGLEGIRPDVAFAQALHETGNFRYGGDVIPLQNNYCGLGTTGGGVKGAWFESPEIGVRAQIQHLLAYSTTRSPLMSVVDPRYELVKKSDKFGQSFTWTNLNGKWAVPGTTYGQMILNIHEKIITGK